MIDFLKIHVGQAHFGRRQDLTIFYEDSNFENNGVYHVAEPMLLKMKRIDDVANGVPPTLQLPTRALISMFKSFEADMLQNNLISPKVEKTECKNETILILQGENLRLHEMNKVLTTIVQKFGEIDV